MRGRARERPKEKVVSKGKKEGEKERESKFRLEKDWGGDGLENWRNRGKHYL